MGWVAHARLLAQSPMGRAGGVAPGARRISQPRLPRHQRQVGRLFVPRHIGESRCRRDERHNGDPGDYFRVDAADGTAGRDRTWPHRSIWPLRLLRDAALLFTLLSAMANFATEGFAALIGLAIGLLAMAMLSYHLHLRERAEIPMAPTARQPEPPRRPADFVGHPPRRRPTLKAPAAACAGLKRSRRRSADRRSGSPAGDDGEPESSLSR
jgi:hypothetical protein